MKQTDHEAKALTIRTMLTASLAQNRPINFCIVSLKFNEELYKRFRPQALILNDTKDGDSAFKFLFSDQEVLKESISKLLSVTVEVWKREIIPGFSLN